MEILNTLNIASYLIQISNMMVTMYNSSIEDLNFSLFLLQFVLQLIESSKKTFIVGSL